MATPNLDSMNYFEARRLLLGAGAVALGVVVVTMVVRGIDPVEVWAAVLFIPVFIAFMLAGTMGGIAGAVGAIAVYVGLRAPAIDAIGFEHFSGLVISRGMAYLLFGAIGGFANTQLEKSLEKLELYDEIDDLTGLRNARSFLTDTDLEMSRATRYQTLFSIVSVDFSATALDALGRKRKALLKDLGTMMREAVRTVDHPIHALDRDVHHLAVVLPETGREGATIFGNRLAGNVAAFLRDRGADVGQLEPTILSFPDDADGVSALREVFATIERAEHPTTSVA